MLLTWLCHLCDLVVACFWQPCELDFILLWHVFNAALAHFWPGWGMFLILFWQNTIATLITSDMFLTLIMTLMWFRSGTRLTALWHFSDTFMLCFWHYFRIFLTKLWRIFSKICHNYVRNVPKVVSNNKSKEELRNAHPFYVQSLVSKNIARGAGGQNEWFVTSSVVRVASDEIGRDHPITGAIGCAVLPEVL